MSLILCIETATAMCSVAVCDGTKVLAVKELNEPNIHNRFITVFIGECLEQAGIRLAQLDAIAVSMGPGSYTGLRIGVATAKGLCFALNKPLIGINTLQSMALGFALQNNTLPSDALLCPMIDARRMEVFTAFFDTAAHFIKPTSADIIDSESYHNELSQQPIYFFGDGAGKCKPTLMHQANAHWREDFQPSAAFMAAEAAKAFATGNFEDLAYFEPFYLKDFVAGTPKKA